MAERSTRMKRILRQQWCSFGPHLTGSGTHALEGGRMVTTRRAQAVRTGRKRRQWRDGSSG